MIRFHFDEHVPHRVAQALRERSIDVTLPGDLSLQRAGDPRHLDFARDDGRVMVTNDRDYLRLHSQGMPHCGIAFYADQHRSIGSLVDALETMVGVYDSEEMHNHVEFI